MTASKKPAPATLAAQGMHFLDPVTGSVVPPILPSTTFARDEHYELTSADFSYARDTNPTYATAETLLCELEGGADALLFSSGMSAAAAVIQTLRPGDHLVIPRVMYWGLRNWIVDYCEQFRIRLDQFDIADVTDLSGRIVAGETKLVWIESPCNPTWDVIDIGQAADIAHQAGARVAIDSTVATPVLTRPIEFGADIVMHSATKYLNGHADVLAGALVTAHRDEMWEAVCENRAELGAIPGAFEAWLLQRGMRTLYLRVSRSCESALAIAKHFSGHPRVSEVLYPGLADHPGHEVARRQMSGGFGGMLSLRIKGGEEGALRMISRCKVLIRATSLGGVESLIEHRYSIEGERSPIPRDLVRISVGIEAVEDLIADLEQALA